MKNLGIGAAGLALLGVLLLTQVAFADNGPHGGYTATTDACAGCHKTHTAVGAKLLRDTVPQLCLSCHGASAPGALTNVTDGIYEGSAEGVLNRGLKAGGFTNAKIDTDWDLVSASAPVTANHLNDGSTGTGWGNGAIGSGPGALNFSLSCVNCHNPHGRSSTTNAATYRILRSTPTNSGAASGVNVTDESSKTYTVSNADNQYMGEGYGSRGTQIASWCAQCHTRYLTGLGSATTDSGDANFRYRHVTNSGSLTCVACHVAHGTSASMGTYSGAVAWPDSTTSPSGNNRSSLLRMDNRGVCEYCHAK